MRGTTHIRSLVLIIPVMAAAPALAQCPNNNVLYNVNATPACPGTATVNCIFGGEYVLVNVVAGNTYTFSTCGGANWDTQITLYNTSGGGALGYNDDACGTGSSLTWTATYTGQLRVLVDRFNCNNQNSCATLTIQCSAPVTGGDCVYVLTMNDSWGDGWGSSYVGVSINGGPVQQYTVTGLTNSVSFAMNIGDVIVLSYNNSGSFQNENSYSLSIQGGGALFVSGTPPAAGISYSGTVDCEPPPAAQQDCAGGTTICSAQSFNNNSTNSGAVADLNSGNQGCLASGEQQGTWYYFSPNASGTIGFTVSPSANIDYDLAVWGPFTSVVCPPPGPPIRCTYASGFSTFNQTGSYNTGLGNGATDNSEGPNGNGWVAPISVTAGQVYILYVDNFSSTGQSFSLSWQLSNGSSLDCTVLPVELVSFTAVPIDDAVELSWTAAGTLESDHFVVERIEEGLRPVDLGTLPAGAGPAIQEFRLTDPSPKLGLNQYRLLKIDVSGNVLLERYATAELHGKAGFHPNPTEGEVNIVLPPTDRPVSFAVIDVHSRVVATGTLRMAAGEAVTRIDIGGLAAGQYMLRLSHTDGRSTMLGPLLKQ